MLAMILTVMGKNKKGKAAIIKGNYIDGKPVVVMYGTKKSPSLSERLCLRNEGTKSSNTNQKH